MKSWQIRLGLVLVVLSALTYLAYYLIVGNLHNMLMYATGDLAFVFINVLLVTIIIQSLLERRGKEAIIGKMSTVIGAFFSELGGPMILMLTKEGTNVPDYGTDLRINSNWTVANYDHAVKKMA